MTASAYDNSVTIFVNGREVNGVEAFMDGNGTIWVSDSLVAARKLFPEETADLYFPDVVEDRQLQDMANAFGYKMEVEGLTAYLEKDGSSSGDTSKPPEEDNDKPIEDQKSVTIYVNDERVTGVLAYLDEDGDVWVEDGYSALKKLFPDETDGEKFPSLVRDLPLEDYASEYGYKMNLRGTKVYLTKQETVKSVTIYVNDKRVSNVSAYLDEDGDVWVEDGYSALKKLFPDETDGEKFPSLVRDLPLEDYASEYGYKMNLRGTKVYLTKQETVKSVTIYVNDKRVSNVSAYLDEDGEIWLENGYSALKKLFPDETDGEKFPSLVRDLPLEDYASEYGYRLTLSGSIAYLIKQDTETQVKVYVNDMRINVDAELANDGTVVFDPKDIYTIFPEATTVKLENGVNYSTSLKRWAEYFKYQYIQKGIRAYLVKDWQKPLEIHFQGKIIDFPDQQPYVANNRTMIPVAIVAEVFGCEVEWKGTTVDIIGEGKKIVLYINSKVYTVNGVEYSMDTPTIVVNNRTIVPIAFVAQALGYNVEFHGEDVVNVVTIDR